MPSQRRMLATARVGRTACSIGMITVGPVTVMIAPNRKASGQFIPTTQCASPATRIQMMSTPQLIRRRTTTP